MSIVRSRSSGPEVELCQHVGTRPRLAKSSSTRGITPGSARAWTAKQATVAGRRLAAPSESGACAAGNDMAEKLLGSGKTANGNGPILAKDRVANSPAYSAEG